MNALPHIPLLARFLAERFECTRIIDIGGKYLEDFSRILRDFDILAVVPQNEVERRQATHKSIQWIGAEFDDISLPHLSPSIVRSSVVLCSDFLEDLPTPNVCTAILKSLMDYAPVAIITSSGNGAGRYDGHPSGPTDPSEAKERQANETVAQLKANGLEIHFAGFTQTDDQDLHKHTALILVGNNNSSLPLQFTPEKFRVVAIMAVYNESDILAPSLTHLRQQGIEVYVIDNWSTDGTFEIAESFLGKGVIGVERWPHDGPSRVFNYYELLKRKETLSAEIVADWFIHHDADEFRESPWQGLPLRDAFFRVDHLGFNAIDFTIINFPPVDNHYKAGTSIDYFKYFEFAKHPSSFRQIKAWKKTSQAINLHSTGGHEVRFSGLKVFPYKFLMRHYPIRSQQHGVRKIFRDRRPRYDRKLKEKGWHNQYDALKPGTSFLASAGDLLLFYPSFCSQYLVERLTGIGTPQVKSNTSAHKRVSGQFKIDENELRH